MGSGKHRGREAVEWFLVNKIHLLSEQFRHGYDRFESTCYYTPMHEQDGIPRMMYEEKWSKRFVKDLEEFLLNCFYSPFLTGKEPMGKLSELAITYWVKGYLKSMAEAFYDTQCVPMQNNALVSMYNDGIDEVIFATKGQIGESKHYDDTKIHFQVFNIREGMMVEPENRIYSMSLDYGRKDPYWALQAFAEHRYNIPDALDNAEILDHRKYVNRRLYTRKAVNI